MRITDAQLYRYRLPLTAPLSVGDRSLTERHGLLLRIVGLGGTEGWGDVAPLPGFSSESLSEARNQVRRVVPKLAGFELMGKGIEDVFRSLAVNDTLPSVRFAIESAVVELLAAVRGESVLQVLGGGRQSVSLNALIPDSTEDLAAAAKRIRAQGFRAAKLKVARRSVEADASRVRTLHAELGEDVALRLDANRGWSYDDAVAFADAVSDVPLSYVEEPLRDPTRLAELADVTGLPIALDETTREYEPTILAHGLHIRAVILKPTLLGGIGVSREWARRAKKRGAVPVVSASYESGVGLRMLIALAASLSEVPAGLSTYTQFKTDVLRPRLALDGSEVNVEPIYSSKVDRSAVERVGSAK